MKVNNENKTMIRLIPLTMLAMTLAFLACDARETVYIGQPPPVPTGVNTITMDEAVKIEWHPIVLDPDYDDLSGYKIWRSLDNHEYTRIATVNYDRSYYVDNNVTNGVIYYYGVSSFDLDGNESDASFNYEIAFDTPRPEGFGVTIYSLYAPGYENRSGFDLSSGQRLFYDDAECDFYLEFDTTSNFQTYFIWLGSNGAMFQDMGYTDSFDDITYAPEDGWSTFPYIEAIAGHTYVLVTEDEHYSKIRVISLDEYPDYNMTFDWGYQIDSGNRELRVNPGSGASSKLIAGLE